jgi:hypothetical protein
LKHIYESDIPTANEESDIEPKQVCRDVQDEVSLHTSTSTSCAAATKGRTRDLEQRTEDTRGPWTKLTKWRAWPARIPPVETEVFGWDGRNSWNTNFFSLGWRKNFYPAGRPRYMMVYGKIIQRFQTTNQITISCWLNPIKSHKTTILVDFPENHWKFPVPNHRLGSHDSHDLCVSETQLQDSFQTKECCLLILKIYKLH